MGFGENDDIVHVRVGGNSCSGVSITAKDVELQCVVDPGTGASKDVSVWVAGQETVASGLFRYGVPTVTSIAPTLMQGGGTVTISGTNFGTDGEAITPSLGTLTCQKVVVTEPHARIECEVPLRDDFCKKTDCQDMQITMDVAGLKSEPSQNFTYALPRSMKSSSSKMSALSIFLHPPQVATHLMVWRQKMAHRRNDHTAAIDKDGNWVPPSLQKAQEV